MTASGWCCRHYQCGGIDVPTANVAGAELCAACAGKDRWPTTNGEG